MTPDNAWAAGFIDGFGKFIVRAEKPPVPRVTVSLPVREPVARLAKILGGTVRHVKLSPPGGKAGVVFVWDVEGEVAMHAIVKVLPGLHIQAEQARTALYYGWYDNAKPSIWQRLFTRNKPGK